MIYLDSAATTLHKPLSVCLAQGYALRHFASVGRGGHKGAALAADAVFHCRELAAALFDCDPEQAVFTLNATHALNIAIKSLVGPLDEVVVSGFEHNAVMRPLQKLGAEVKIAGRKLFDPRHTLASFRQAIGPYTKAVICTYVSNVFGYILPIAEIAELCEDRGVPLIVDASQAAGSLPISLKKLRAAFIAMPGHKGLYGPQGTGILLCGMTPDTVLEGGTGSLSKLSEMPDFLPDRAEAGTHNVCGIAGLAKGIGYVLKKRPESIFLHETALRRFAAAKFEALGVECFECPECQSGVLSVRVPDADSETAARMLSEHGIAVRAGLHCAPVAHESAGTLDGGTVRLSFSAFSTERDAAAAAAALKKIVKRKK